MNLPRPEIMQFIDRLRIDLEDEEPDPLTGYGSIGERTEAETPLPDLPVAFIPVTMVEDADYSAACADPIAWQKLRCRHDFE